MWRKCKEMVNVRLLQNIVLDLLFIVTILKHLVHADGASHAASKSSANL